MTREEAQKLAQEKLCSVTKLLQECMELADEHKFTLDLYGHTMDYEKPHHMPYEHTYFPKGVTMEQATEEGHPWCGISDFAIERTKHEGVWMSSSDYGDYGDCD